MPDWVAGATGTPHHCRPLLCLAWRPLTGARLRNLASSDLTPLLMRAVACGLLLCVVGWWRGEAVRRQRKAAGLPSVDTALMTQHDRFNLLTLVRKPGRPSPISHSC
eukprot:COSAG02_NODE_1557_length_11939_cov_343.602872_13_plen_107_part_00